MTPQTFNATKTVPGRRIYSAQLRSLTATTQLTNPDQYSEEAGVVKINFPSMPEEIDLSRVAEYTVHSNQALPDGFHVYKQTAPLELQLSFELSAFDREYVLDGPIGLLTIGAKLHSLTLPILQSVGGGATVDLTVPSRPAGEPKKDGSEAGLEGRAENSNQTGSASEFSTQAPFYFPPACLLDLVVGYSDGPGIRCVGYVSRVSVKLKGPWLTSSTNAFKNLPSKARYEFTFVHAPSYSNSFSKGDFGTSIQTVQAGAREIFTRFYNTLDMSSRANLSFAGLNEFEQSSLLTGTAAGQSVQVQPQ
jgi:hypothetical protein